MALASPTAGVDRVAADGGGISPPGASPRERAAEGVTVQALEVVTSVQLDPALLGALGLDVVALAPTAPARAPHPLSFVRPDAPSFRALTPGGLGLAMGRDGVFRGFTGGLRHGGGFRIESRRGDGGAGSDARGPITLDFTAFGLRPGARASTLEVLDAAGRPWLVTAGAQWDLDRGRGLLRYLNADLRILPAFARRLGDARLAGVTVGALTLDAWFPIDSAPPGPGRTDGPAGFAADAATDPCLDWSGQTDVALVDMDAVGQAPGLAIVGGRVVVVPSVRLKNVGTANVPWYSKFSPPAPPYGNDQHPFLVWQMLREAGGVLEPLGHGDLKHAFATGNENCDPGACSTNLHILGRGCEDPYNIHSNNWFTALGPRAEVTASTGIWAHCHEPLPNTPSHFDQVPPFCFQDLNALGEDAFTHGMAVAESMLEAPVPAVSPLRYFVEAFYIVRDDIDIFNTMGHRQVTPARIGPAGPWLFTPAAAFAQGPAINAWVDPTAPGPGADNRVLSTGEGHLQLAVRVTDLGNGRRRYAYALQNHDFDRRLDSFHIPFDAAHAIAENVNYADGDAFADNDWVATIDGSGITWTLPDMPPDAGSPAAELDFATLVSFRFDSDQAEAAGAAALGVADPAAASPLRIQTLVPSAGSAPPAGFHTLAPCRLLDTRALPGGPAPIASGVARELDTVGAGAACGVPAEARALAINVTVTEATSAGELAIHSAGTPGPPSVVAFSAGVTRANNAVVQLSLVGRLKIRPSLAAAGTVHVVVDVVGYFVPTSP